MRRRGATLLVVGGLAGALSAAALASPPQRVVIAFAQAPLGPRSAFTRFTRRSHLPHIALAAPARRIGIIHWNGARQLLVAPIKGGGFCESLTGPYGGAGCYPNPARLDPGLTGAASWIALNGSFTDSLGVRLRVTYQDGRQTNIPIRWVGRPISAGFFVFPISPQHRLNRHRPTTLALYSTSGALLESVSVYRYHN